MLRFHCAETSDGALAASRRREPRSISARIDRASAGFTDRSASTARAGGMRSTTAAASAVGSALIWLAAACSDAAAGGYEVVLVDTALSVGELRRLSPRAPGDARSSRS